MTTTKSNNGPATEEDVALERRYDITPAPRPKEELAPRRPTKFTKAVQRKIVVVLQLGLLPDTAANHAGITEKTLLNWWARGQMAGPDAEGVELELYEFSELCRQARANPEVGLVSILWRHARADGHVAIKFLEKLFPEKYGKKSNVEVTGKVEHEHKRVDYSKYTNEELEEMERLALKGQRERLKEGAIDAEIIE